MLNYSDFKSYRSNFHHLVESFDEFLDTHMASEGSRFIGEVKPLTPVGESGDLRAHWDLDDLEKLANEVRQWFVNSMEYASYVEYGHAKPHKSGLAGPGDPDWVNGFFMMTKALNEIDQTMEASFDEAFSRLLKTLGV